MSMKTSRCVHKEKQIWACLKGLHTDKGPPEHWVWLVQQETRNLPVLQAMPPASVSRRLGSDSTNICRFSAWQEMILVISDPVPIPFLLALHCFPSQSNASHCNLMMKSMTHWRHRIWFWLCRLRIAKGIVRPIGRMHLVSGFRILGDSPSLCRWCPRLRSLLMRVCWLCVLKTCRTEPLQHGHCSL